MFVRNICKRLTLFTIMLGLFTLMGCDGNSETSSGATITFQGRVTDQQGFGKSANIEGAAVTAANVESNGSLTPISGETTTDAAGNFSLEVDGATRLVVLTAEKADFRSEVLVSHEARTGGTVRTMPMTVESEAEASVYVAAAHDGSGGDEVTVADVAVYVNERLATEWKNGGTTAAEIAAGIKAAVDAEAAYFDESDDADVDSDEYASMKQKNYLELEAALSTAASAEAEAAAISAFEAAMIDAYTEAGASIEAQAKARQAGGSALVRFYSQASSNARFAAAQQAQVLASLATALAIENEFQAQGASQERMSALISARQALTASLRAASTLGEMAEAKNSYNLTVEAQTAAEIDIDAVVLAAVEAVLAPADATLDASVAAAVSAAEVATAYETYYTTAEASVTTALLTSNNAELGAEVFTLLRVN